MYCMDLVQLGGVKNPQDPLPLADPRGLLGLRCNYNCMWSVVVHEIITSQIDLQLYFATPTRTVT